MKKLLLFGLLVFVGFVVFINVDSRIQPSGTWNPAPATYTENQDNDYNPNTHKQDPDDEHIYNFKGSSTSNGIDTEHGAKNIHIPNIAQK